jgi:hypothetical protein
MACVMAIRLDRVFVSSALLPPMPFGLRWWQA